MTETRPRSNQRIVTFGGGTGHFYLLRGLVQFNAGERITAVPGTWDDVGSSGRLRTELGVLPPGDARQCLLALMEDDRQRQVAQRRFDDRLQDVDGPLRGHSVGNLITARLEQIFRGQDRGIEAARALFRISGRVLPVSLTDLRLVARTSDGNEIEGETNIDLRALREDFQSTNRVMRIYFNTSADVNPAVQQAIAEADKIVFSAGDLFTSVLPHLLVNGIQEALAARKGRLIWIMNLMTKPGETDDYKASDYLRILTYYLGAGTHIDYLIANSSVLDPEVLEIYAQEGQVPVEVDDDACRRIAPGVRIIRAPLATYQRKEHLLRHDPVHLANTIISLD